jgi:hypothetical protein
MGVIGQATLRLRNPFGVHLLGETLIKESEHWIQDKFLCMLRHESRVFRAPNPEPAQYSDWIS